MNGLSRFGRLTVRFRCSSADQKAGENPFNRLAPLGAWLVEPTSEAAKPTVRGARVPLQTCRKVETRLPLKPMARKLPVESPGTALWPPVGGNRTGAAGILPTWKFYALEHALNAVRSIAAVRFDFAVDVAATGTFPPNSFRVASFVRIGGCFGENQHENEVVRPAIVLP